jgi:hypothetical protein
MQCGTVIVLVSGSTNITEFLKTVRNYSRKELNTRKFQAESCVLINTIISTFRFQEHISSNPPQKVLQHYMKVSGQVYALATLTWGKELPESITQNSG